MILGIISDTHDRLENTKKALELFISEGVEHIIHCGDWKSVETLDFTIRMLNTAQLHMSAVLGNNDSEIKSFFKQAHASQLIELHEGVFEITFGDTHCAVYHGHHAPTLRRVRENTQYDIVFLGHTHKPVIEHIGDRMIVNPGSVAFSIPRSKNWLPTVAIVNTETMEASIVNL